MREEDSEAVPNYKPSQSDDRATGAGPAVVAAARAMMADGWWLTAVAGKKPFGDPWRHGAGWRIPPVLDDLLARLRLPGMTGIGFLGGEPNRGVVPLDFDSTIGELWWREECRKSGIDVDQFPSVITPGKLQPNGTREPGRHRYVLDVRGTLGNAEGALHALKINIRGKGQCVLPPSPHPDGGCYAWAVPLARPVPPCPDFVYAAIERHVREAPPPGTARHERPRIARHDPHARQIAYSHAALTRAATALASTPAGGRNTALNNASAALANLAHLGGFSEARARAALHDACVRNGLIADDGERAFAATFASGWSCGIASPRDPPAHAAPTMPNAFKRWG